MRLPCEDCLNRKICKLADRLNDMNNTWPPDMDQYGVLEIKCSLKRPIDNYR